ncbi:MAG: MBL fold metallo-hydrolase [Acutalibacteraceae bacterium]
MKITVLSDNKAENGLKGEWGLSLFIEFQNKTYLLDAGASSLFSKNAQKLGVDLSAVDAAFLSHAHYDHSDGLPEFFSLNKKAPLYLNGNCKENCYGKRFIFSKYIGIKKGIMEFYGERLNFVSGFFKVEENVFLLPHAEGDFSLYGKKNGLFTKENGKWSFDNFNHEQSLVFKTEKGLVILNSCCHTGADNIIKEAAKAFPEEKIFALIGGFHLYRSKKDEVETLCDKIEKTGIEKIYTGHCTGDKAFEILKTNLRDKAEELYVGKVIEI